MNIKNSFADTNDHNNFAQHASEFSSMQISNSGNGTSS